MLMVVVVTVVLLLLCFLFLLFLLCLLFLLQVFGWDATGTIEFNDVVCTGSVSAANGGCLYVSGVGVVNDGTVMRGNQAKAGGCLCKLPWFVCLCKRRSEYSIDGYCTHTQIGFSQK